MISNATYMPALNRDVRKSAILLELNYKQDGAFLKMVVRVSASKQKLYLIYGGNLRMHQIFFSSSYQEPIQQEKN